MANVGEVLSALGSVAGSVDRAAGHLDGAESEFGDAHSALAVALDGCRDPQAGDALLGLAAATAQLAEAIALLGLVTARLDAFVARICGASGTSVPPGARAARAPIAGRVHPTNVPPPPVHQRDYEWAAHVGAQLTEWERGRSTEALVFDVDGQDWQVNSGVDAKLTAAASTMVENMIANGEVGTSADMATNRGEWTGLRKAVTHAETKAAIWAVATGKRFVDVVTNREFVCGQKYEPGNRLRPPGCAQAVAAILPVGYTMRVWRRGVAAPFVVTGRGEEG